MPPEKFSQPIWTLRPVQLREYVIRLVRKDRSPPTLLRLVPDAPSTASLRLGNESPWFLPHGWGRYLSSESHVSRPQERLPESRLISEHVALQDALGGIPSVYALYRFGAKLRRFQPILDKCLDGLVASVSAALPDYGVDVAIDASDRPAFANGQRYVSKDGPERERFSDPDASWGHRSAVSTRSGGGFYGFKIHAAVCARTDLPIAWRVKTARAAEATVADDLLVRVRERVNAQTVALDKGYDVGPVYDACERHEMLPIIPLRKTTAVARGDHRAPECEHGTWTFSGADFKRKAAKWRCPTGECEPKSMWRKSSRLHPLVPRETKRWGDLYRGRSSVEREFGRLKHEYGLGPLRVRGLERVQLHADLCIMARLAVALARARAVPLAA